MNFVGTRHRLLPVVLAAALSVSCAGTRGASEAEFAQLSSSAAPVQGDLRKTERQVQSQLMGFADRHYAAIYQAAWEFQMALPTPQARQDAARERLVSLLVPTDIATGPNPGNALLDMVVYVTLKRMVWEDYWGPEVFGNAAENMIDAYRIMEADIWEVAADVYTLEQLEDLRRLIREWRGKHPDQVTIAAMRLSELSESRQVSTLVEAGKPGGLIAPIEEANRNIEETRMLAERMVFMLNRMQISVNLQLDLAFANVTIQPEVQTLLSNSDTYAAVAEGVGDTFGSLVDRIPRERAAAIDQIFAGLRMERERIFDELTSEEDGIRPTIAELRQTAEAATLMSQEGDELIKTIDNMLTGMAERSKPGDKPFDILEYQATAETAIVLAREANAALAALERIVESPGFEQNLPLVIAGANRLEEEVVNQILDRLFVRGVLLVLVLFAALVGYRLVVSRFGKDLPSRDSRK